MAFEKFITPKRGGAGKYDTPYVIISRSYIVLNEKASEQIGDAFNYVVLHFDKETCSIGLWFWKERVLDCYSLCKENKRYRNCFLINGRAFSKRFEIFNLIERIGKNAFPLVRDENNKDFYTAALKK